MSIKFIEGASIKISDSELSEMMSYHKRGDYSRFNEEFLKKVYPNSTNMIREVRECIESVIDDTEGTISCVQEALDQINSSNKKSLELIKTNDKFDSYEFINAFATEGKDKLLPDMVDKICFDFSDTKELLTELSKGNEYVFSVKDLLNQDKYLHKYYKNEKDIATDLLDTVNIKINTDVERDL